MSVKKFNKFLIFSPMVIIFVFFLKFQIFFLKKCCRDLLLFPGALRMCLSLNDLAVPLISLFPRLLTYSQSCFPPSLELVFHLFLLHSYHYPLFHFFTHLSLKENPSDKPPDLGHIEFEVTLQIPSTNDQ